MSPTRRQADIMFEEVKNEILAVGFDEILMIPRSTDPRTELAVSLLNDAGRFYLHYHPVYTKVLGQALTHIGVHHPTHLRMLLV